MRADMAKKLVERGSRGGGYARRTRVPVDLEELDLTVSRGRLAEPDRGNKSFGEYLAPLRRFVESQVGRPWNKVSSEMREHIKPGNTVQEHVFQHLDSYIAIKVRKVGVTPKTPCGVVDVGGAWRAGMARPVEEGRLYVDPDDGIIKRARWRLKGPVRTVASAGHALRPMGRDRLIAARNGMWISLSAVAYEIQVNTFDRREKWFVVGGHRHDTWIDPLLGEITPYNGTALAQIEARHGPGLLARDGGPLSRQQLRWHRLANAKAR